MSILEINLFLNRNLSKQSLNYSNLYSSLFLLVIFVPVLGISLEELRFKSGK